MPEAGLKEGAVPSGKPLRSVGLQLGLVLAVLLVLVAGPAAAETPRDIDWNSLLSAEEVALRAQMQRLQLQLRALPAEEQKALPRVASEMQIEHLHQRGDISDEEFTRRQRQLGDKRPSEQYPELARAWTQMEDLKRQLAQFTAKPNQELIGQRVRLSGYLLPLEFDAGDVSEFLLVPIVGACIHVPPPPPNQIVQVAMTGRYPVKSVYAPVTVTGTIRHSQGQVNLFLTDGSGMVEHGYRLDADVVEAGGK